jgi:hypothetical protein
MNEIPRRSFLALLGAAVVAAKLPPEPLLATPLQAFTPEEIKSDPVTIVRRWYVTRVEICDGWGGERSRVRLVETFFPEDDAAKFPQAQIDYGDIIACSVERPVETYMTQEMGPIHFPLPATAEVEISTGKAMDLQRKMMGGLDLVEFVGDAPL